MDLNINLHESKHDQNDDDVAAPGELLEDCWFFGNLLQTKSKSSRILRSFSDPCSSSSFPGKSYEETYESIKKIDRTTTRERRSNRKISSSSKNLVRAPSLPTSLESDDHFHDDEEMEFSMGKLIRQASLNHSDTRPPRRNSAKSVTPSSSLTKQKSRRKPEMESMKSEVMNDQLKTQKSLKDLEIEELQGFKDLGFGFDEKELSSSNVVSILQEKKRVEECGERRGARPPYLSEAWAAQSSAPPVPRWGGKRPTEDMKAQIKFWARAVASNVRQEC